MYDAAVAPVSNKVLLVNAIGFPEASSRVADVVDVGSTISKSKAGGVV